MFAPNCLRGILVERSSTSRHPRAKAFARSPLLLRHPCAPKTFARNDHLKTVSFYDGSGRMTQVQDPTDECGIDHLRLRRRGSAQLRGPISGPTQLSSTYQEQGWTNSGTSGSPADGEPSAAATGSHTDPNGNVTTRSGSTGYELRPRRRRDAGDDVNQRPQLERACRPLRSIRLNRISQMNI